VGDDNKQSCESLSTARQALRLVLVVEAKGDAGLGEPPIRQLLHELRYAGVGFCSFQNSLFETLAISPGLEKKKKNIKPQKLEKGL
jgi:hypothetical protein